MAKKGRPTKKQAEGRGWTDVTRQILHHTSTLAHLIREASSSSLEAARDRMQEFRDAWIKTGDGDVLPASGDVADIPGTLSDVDVFDPIIELLEQKIDEAKTLEGT
jgi:hypothetical protein